MEEMEISVTRQHSGLLLTTVHGGRLHQMLYIDYTEDEAKEEFREYVLARE